MKLLRKRRSSDPERTGVVASRRPSQSKRLVWEFDTSAFSPAISDGVVNFGSNDRHLYAVDALSGQEKRKFETDGAVVCAPAISDGVVYSGRPDQHLYAVDALRGQEKGKFKSNGAGVSPGPSRTKWSISMVAAICTR
jgi:outer membrane protein assembly factor BamB